MISVWTKDHVSHFEIQRKFRREHAREASGFRRRYGSKGGTNTVTQQSGPPSDVLAHYNQVYNQAQNVAAQPYQPYTGATVAGFTPLQQSAFSNLPTAINAGQPFINQASQDITNASTALDPSHFASTVGAYQNPYTQKVVDATQAEFNNQNQQQQQGVIGNAVSSGAWGGDRSAVAQGITAGQEALAQAPVIANLYNTGFQNATNAAQSNAWLQSQAGFGMANLGQEAQQQGLTGVQAELGAGSAQQGLAQQELNAPYQAYQAATAYPFQTTNWLEGMATGTGSLSGTQGSTTTPGPSTASQVAGLGLAGLGAYNSLNQAGAFSGAGSSAASSLGAYAPTSAANASDLAAFYDNVPASRGGEIGGFAAGGDVPGPPNSSVTGIPQTSGSQSNGMLGGSNNLLGGGGNLLGTSGNLLGGGKDLLTTPTGNVSVTTGLPVTVSPVGQIINDIGQIAASYWGGPGGGFAAGLGSRYTPEVSPGYILAGARGGKIGGLSPVTVRPRGFDTGGGITPGLDASVGGNPMLAQAAQSYNGLPTEQLQELAARFPPNSPQGSLVQRALQMRHANPSSDPAKPAVAATPGLAPSGSSPGMAPMGQGMFARGGEADEDDDALPDLVVPQVGPSVPGGLVAGLSPGLTAMQAAPEQMLAQHAMTMNRSGSYVPPPPDLAPVVMDAAQRHNVDPKALAWMLSQESHWNPNAFNPSSGTIGLGQFKPATAREEGIDPRDPVQAIHGAADYLSKQLARSGGDYETAIGHYGTFSTGHGKDADNAVRGQFRAFMQGASHGGAIRLADGGDPGDGDYVDQSGLLVPGARSMDSPVGGFTGITDGSGGSMAPPPAHAPVAGLTPLPPGQPGAAPPADSTTNTHTAGFGPQSGNDVGTDTALRSDRQPIKASPWEAVMAAGFGMMAGTSPHALTNIGTGGLAGLKDYQQQRQLAVLDQIRRDTADTNAVWRLSQAKTAGIKVDQNGRIVDAKVPLIQSQTNLANARTAAQPQLADARTAMADAASRRADAAGLVGQARADYIKTQTALAPGLAGARAITADAAARRADAAGLVGQARADYIRTQTEQLSTLTGIKQQNADAATTRAMTGQDVGDARVPLLQAQTAAVPINAQTRATQAATGQGGLALRQQALAALIAQRGITNDRNAVNDAQKQINTMTTEQLQAMAAGKNPITGATPPPTQLGATVNQLRANAQRAAPPARVVPPPTPGVIAAPPASQATPVAPTPSAAPSAPAIPTGLPPTAKSPDGGKNWYVPNPNGGWLQAIPSGG